MTEPNAFTSVLGPTITRYVGLKQALGRGYAIERAVLRHLDVFLTVAESDLTSDTFERWCLTQQHVASGVRRNRMRIVRNLCLYRRRAEPECFVPDPHQFPPLHQPIRPHIFTQAEIARLLRAARALEPAHQVPLRRELYRLAIALLYTAGLRRGELLRLTFGDYEPRQHTLLIRETKFHKSRLLPLSPDCCQEVESYRAARRALRLPDTADTPLIESRRGGGKAYTAGGFSQCMRRLFRAAAIKTAAGQLPRVHDMRHCFAVHALLRWYRSGADVQAKLPFLAVYMGHVSIVSTHHYLHFVEELASSASDRFARQCAGLVTFGGPS